MKHKMLLLTLAAMLFGWCGAMADLPDDTLWTKEIFSEYIVAAGFTPDGSQVIAVAHSGLLFFDAETGEFIRKYDEPYKDYGKIFSAIVSSNSTKILANVVGLGIAVWDYDTEEMLFKSSIPFALADDANLHFNTDHQGLVRAKDFSTNEIVDTRYFEELKNFFSTMYVSSNGKYVYLVNFLMKGETRIRYEWLIDWDKNELFEISMKAEVGDNIASFSPDGRYMATGGEDGTVTIYDLNQDIILDNEKKGKKMVKKIDHQINAYTHTIRDLSFSKDSKYLYTLGGRIDHKQIWVIDMLDFSVFYKYPDPFGNGLDLAIDPSNKKIVVGGFNYLFLLNNKAHTSIEDQYFESILYPNPTSNIVNIEFENKHTSNVNISIYNESGVMIETIADMVFEDGKQSIVWNCSSVSSGIYFCVIRSNHFQKTYKIVVQR